MAAFFLLMLALLPTALTSAQGTLTPLSPDEAHFGRLIECTAEEKRCFTHSRFLNQEDKLCYIIDSRDGCSSGRWYLDKEMALKTGRYVGKCVTKEPCYNWQIKKPNGECVGYGQLCKNKTLFQINMFGEPTCVSRNWTLPVVEVQQPEEPDLCRVPNFWNASIPIFDPAQKPFQCSEDAYRCFLDNRILWPIDGLCYELGYKEPCAQQGYWLVVDEEEYLNGTGVMTPVCRPRPCPEGHLLMQFDRKCHSREEVEQVLCSGEYVLTDSVGYSGCDIYRPNVLPNTRTENGLCTWAFAAIVGSAEKIALSACPASDIGYCPREIIPPKVSLPEL